MEWSGFALLLLVGIGIVSTGLPAAFILIGAATLGALLGVATDTIPLSLLSALPNRLVNLLENDLLQALPLYVTMGLLLGRSAGGRRALPHRALRCCRSAPRHRSSRAWCSARCSGR